MKILVGKIYSFCSLLFDCRIQFMDLLYLSDEDIESCICEEREGTTRFSHLGIWEECQAEHVLNMIWYELFTHNPHIFAFLLNEYIIHIDQIKDLSKYFPVPKQQFKDFFFFYYYLFRMLDGYFMTFSSDNAGKFQS